MSLQVIHLDRYGNRFPARGLRAMLEEDLPALIDRVHFTEGNSDIVGVGAGFARVDGILQPYLVVRARRDSLANVRSSLPRRLTQGGFAIRLEEGEVARCAVSMYSLFGRSTALRPGHPIGTQKPARYATLTALGRDAVGPCAVSCEHVFDGAPPTTPVHRHRWKQVYDDATLHIGSVTRRGSSLTPDIDAVSIRLKDIPLDARPVGIGRLARHPVSDGLLRRRVQKFGCTTKHTTGTILRLMSTKVDRHGGKIIRGFEVEGDHNGRPYKAFCDEGDSGALCVENAPKQKPRPIAMLVARTTLIGNGLITPLGPILQALGVEFLNKI